MIPLFDESGCLPPGIHPATLEEIEARRRVRLADEFSDEIRDDFPILSSRNATPERPSSGRDKGQIRAAHEAATGIEQEECLDRHTAALLRAG